MAPVLPIDQHKTPRFSMPRLGSKTRTAKVYDDEYRETAQKGAQTAKNISAFDGLLQDISMSVLHDKINQFGPDFVEKVSEVKKVQYKDMIFPQGTRFMRQGSRAAAFVIELPPSVRTLTFKGAIDEEEEEWRSGLPSTTRRWALALPYFYFIPVFEYQKGNNVLERFCVACRTEPLRGLDDMLYCINLPNSYRIEEMPAEGVAAWTDGIIPSVAEMDVCQGYTDIQRSRSFSASEDDLDKMTAQAITHYWSSRFVSNELGVTYSYMQQADKRFKTLRVWQNNSKKDPLFVLKADYPPAIRLNALFDSIKTLDDTKSDDISGQTNQYIKRIHKEVWSEILRMEAYQKIRVDLCEALISKFNDAMAKFSAALSQNLSSIPNDTIKRHVLLSITIALREAIK